MEQLIAFIVFGVLIAISVYGYVISNNAARSRGRIDRDRPIAGVSAD